MIFDRKPSMRRKLVLMFIGATIVLQLILGSIAQHIIKAHFYELSANYIDERFLALNGSNEPITPERGRMITGFEDASLKVWNVQNDKITYQSSETSLPSSPRDFFLRHQDDSYSLQWTDDKNDNYLTICYFASEDTTIVVGLNINEQIAFFDAIALMFFWFNVVMAIFVGLYSIVIVNNSLRPLKRLEGYLMKIRPGHLNIRLPTKDLPIELEELSHVQNAMIDRLDEGFKRLSDFSSDIAHELRTPLTNLTTQTQVVLAADRTPHEYQDVLGSNLEELERINKTMNDTLYLAKAENSLLYKSDELLHLGKVIDQIVEYHSIVAEDKEITIEREGDGELMCDKSMFQRAINNLLSNAVRHSASFSVIKVFIQQPSDKDLTIRITNTGDTIPEESLPFIFQRFYRKDKSREHDYGFGAGLGLAITKSIIETYSGTITAESSKGETTFEIRFPIEDKPQPIDGM